ncbi:60S acidic ribosomal protein P1, partial [Ralstonia pseudosolanacearum]|uniref:60S acidic ribosomal protein P1 n=1 Tax=Ralstonia pseudosolanacearum TaxID=1310165 RepID=UPI003D17002C
SLRLSLSQINRKMSSVGELACSYACLALHDDGIPITADKIATLVKAAGIQIEGYWPGLFAKLVEKRNVEDLITNVGSGGGGAAVAVTASTGGAAVAATEAPAAVEKKEEPKEESDDDMGFSLFD